jgi:hypothetical protein
MLPVEQVTPFIRHEDPLVVDLALHHLREVRWPEPLTGDFILDAQPGWNDERLRWLGDFRVSQRTFDYALRFIREHRDDSDAAWPWRVIVRAPERLLSVGVLEELQKSRPAADWLERELRFRMTRVKWSTQQLRDRFLEACAEANDDGSAMSEHIELSALCAQLVDRAESISWGRAHLQHFYRQNEWTEIWLFKLLGDARGRECVDLVLSRFAEVNYDDNEALTDELGLAISTLCGPGEIPRLESMFLQISDDKRARLVNAVGSLRFAEAEALLLNEARRPCDEEADDARAFALQALCEMLPTDDAALELIADATERVAYNIGHCDLEALAIPLGIIIGKPFPQTDAWRARITGDARDAERVALRRRRSPELGAIVDLLDRIGSSTASNQVMGSWINADAPVQSVVPRNKIGRNDPCPCGSGKKYKKCCLNNPAPISADA